MTYIGVVLWQSLEKSAATYLMEGCAITLVNEADFLPLIDLCHLKQTDAVR